MAGENRIAVQGMVQNVADQEYGREREGQQHARAMCFSVAVLDVIQPHAERCGAKCVQHRVESRQKRPPRGEISRCVMEVEQPQKERYSEPTCYNDSADHRTRTDLCLSHADN